MCRPHVEETFRMYVSSQPREICICLDCVSQRSWMSSKRFEWTMTRHIKNMFIICLDYALMQNTKNVQNGLHIGDASVLSISPYISQVCDQRRLETHFEWTRHRDQQNIGNIWWLCHTMGFGYCTWWTGGSHRSTFATSQSSFTTGFWADFPCQRAQWPSHGLIPIPIP